MAYSTEVKSEEVGAFLDAADDLGSAQQALLEIEQHSARQALIDAYLRRRQALLDLRKTATRERLWP